MQAVKLCEEYIEDLEKMAAYNTNIAIDYLRRLVETPSNERVYVRRLDSATKYIHQHVWSSRLSIEKVEGDLIPLLAQAFDSISESGDFAAHVKKTISGRIGNLRRYCEGLPSVWNFRELRRA